MAIITISREMGSGGIPIAHRTAEKLGYTLVDGDSIAAVAENYGLTPEALENADEKPPAFVEKIDEKVETDFHRVELIILDYALKGNVVIYGRGGQDLLKGISSVLRVRVIAPFDERVERWAEREWIDPDLARILVRKSDQQRAGFIRYYFDRDWQDPLHYDLSLNTSRISDETAVKLICEGVKDKNLQEHKEAGKKLLQDRILGKRAEIKLLGDGIIEGLHHYHFHIAVTDGVITLDGHVHSNEQHQAALAAVRSLDGVKSIDDQLEVRHYRSTPSEH
ncbi:MAG: transport-associated protein [Desulfuromonadales bacterium GWD2_61_12]|nr:MAG: transport-associated protein [Desulfuromonadales bacterium GWC2_61_20]OGR32775.1 MAG: transport-associated protein [Desulfuromonadales bacterium GWD2_61_12]HAD04746.1 transport-associated protein [Desulfuromonas sp.]HBT82749.1 transport-associated protein [Desulfuromonas sp.]